MVLVPQKLRLFSILGVFYSLARSTICLSDIASPAFASADHLFLQPSSVIDRPHPSGRLSITPDLLSAAPKSERSDIPQQRRSLRPSSNSLGHGVLRGKFHREWAYGRWILDFLFWENGLGIEIDGGYHQSATQRKLDAQKNADCAQVGITLIRISNHEVFGDRDKLVAKLREGYRAANRACKRTWRRT